MSSLSEKSAFEAFARMEERIETNERQIKAASEIDEEFTGDTLQRDFKQLEKGAARCHGRQPAARAQAEDGHAAAPASAPANKALGAGGQRGRGDVHAEIERPGEGKSR